MEFEDSPVDQTPTNGPQEAHIALTCYDNPEVTIRSRGLNAEATSCNDDTTSYDESDSDPEDGVSIHDMYDAEDGVSNHDMYDSGNDADVSGTSDSDSDSYIEVCADSDDCNSDINDSSDEEAEHAHRFLLNNLPRENTFSEDSTGADLSDEAAHPSNIDDPFRGFVDRSVVVEYVCTVDFYETMESVSGNRRDPDIHPWIQEHHLRDQLSEDSLMVI